MIKEEDKYRVIPVFSSPLFKVKEKFNMTNNLKNYIDNLPMSKNDNNLISQNKHLLTTDQNMIPLRNYIINWLNYYTKTVLSIKDVEFYITQSWLNITRQTESHHPHEHPNSIISGVFHFEDKLSNIEFSTDKPNFNLQFEFENYNLYNGTSWSFETEANTLLLFPSKTKHRVKVNNKNTNRTSLSFNTYVKGKLGSEEGADLLYLT